MGVVRFLSDKLVNFVANLGTERDKAAGSFYAPVVLTDEQLHNAYRGAWFPRKVVDIPAKDATRRWRAWQASKAQIEKIEAEEKRLQVQARTMEALIKARLWGGAAIFIGTGETDTSKPLVPERVQAGGIRYLTVMSRRDLSATEQDRDVMSPNYGKPKAYRLGGSAIEIHPSRLVIFTGADIPDQDLASGNQFGWGDSVLQAVFEAIQQIDSTMANVASLIFEAKVDVIRIPDFMQGMQDPKYEKLVLERMRLAAMAKGINGTLMLDKDEEYDSKSANFGTLPDIMDRFLQNGCGAADIPATRMLSQSPAGMNSTGEADLRNYYDRIQSSQELDITPAMSVLDECLVRSALGSRPPEIHYVWNSLWQTTAKERADIGKTTAETIKIIAETKLFPPDALSKAAETLLVENSVMPGLESALEEFGSEVPDDGQEEEGGTTKLQDAAARTLYVSRKVLNAAAIIDWAKAQGFETTLPAEDLHVTVAYSKTPVDWMAVAQAWTNKPNGNLTSSAGGPRMVEQFGEGAIVLLFNNTELTWRHQDILDAGASWDWPDYQPHITFTYQPGSVDLDQVEPYRGVIELGPEIFEELREDWADKLREE
ncbi:anti-CBASS protein Acb1 family protein [Pseudomonas fluorescens]|uniref:Anti-CBASS protein Acb1 n=1 Tax=Pseudomonas fluorescens TaxID=294 RepID=A0A448BJA3_PSEFL|nr:HI1409 family phage-associated protein [Pseudomonas fluorescens]